MARKVIDLRTYPERYGITSTQQTAQSIADIFKTIGQAEQKRRERQTLDRITRAISGGATTVEAIAAAAGQGPQFSAGIPGILQKFGGAFQPSPGGMRQGIQQAIIGDALRKALTPSLLTPKQQTRAAKIEAGLAPRAVQQRPTEMGKLIAEGYTPTDARLIRDISHGLKPRASATKSLEQKSLPEQLSFWQTAYNKTLDPEWGGMRPAKAMDSARELAKQNMDRITAAMRQSTQADTSDLDLETDLKNAMSAIKSGAPPDQVYERLIEAYPDSEDKIRKILGLRR